MLLIAPPTSYGVVPEHLWILALVLAAFGCAAVRPLRYLTTTGAVAGWLLGMLVAWCFGIAGFATLMITFLITNGVGRLPGRKPSEQRSGRQVVANGFAAVGGCVLALAGYADLGLAVYLGGLSFLGADTVSSELGVRYGGATRKLWGGAMRDGESGGVTNLGLCVSLLGALIAPVTFGLFHEWDHVVLGAAATAGVVGGLLDSVIGATLQYRGALEDGTVVETRRVDGKTTKRVTGFRWLDNDAVNLVGGIAAGAIAAGLFGLWHAS